MLSALIAGSLLAQIEQSPRFKTVLDNGCHIYVERLASPGKASAALALSTSGIEDGAAQHGWVHLVEHLAARGPKRDLDRRLESQGMMLTANTTRDAMVFQITGRPDQMPLAIKCLRELGEPLTVTEEDIKKEIVILREEFVQRPDAEVMSEAAWISAFGSAGAGSFGDLEAMASATPGDALAVHAKLFRGGGASLSVTGDVDVAVMGERLKEVFGSLAKSEVPVGPERAAEAESAAESLAYSYGSVRGVRTEGLDDVRGAASLMAAFGLSIEIPGSMPLYTPSTWPGLVLITNSSAGALDRIDEMSDNDILLIYPQARASTIGFMDRATRDPVRLAGLTAVLCRQNSSVNSERLRDWIGSVRQADFLEAVRRFERSRAFVVTGGAR